jgi:cytochrome c oxidase subunit 2
VREGKSIAVQAALAALAAAAPAQSHAELIGAPQSGQMGFLPAATPIAGDIQWLHNVFLMPVIVGISLMVLALLAYVAWRFNEKANPVAWRTTHNGPLEILWTILPVVVLVIIAVPSFRLLTEQMVIPEPDMTIKATASQWHWNYTYPKSAGGFAFDSLIVEDKDLKPGDIRLLTVDNAIYVPVGKVVEVDVVSQDVIHSFSIPSLGVRMDAVPGRLNKAWFKSEQEGVFYGQCSNICGIDHAYMPIEVHVVSQQAYDGWLDKAKKTFAASDGVDLASAAPKAAP